MQETAQMSSEAHKATHKKELTSMQGQRKYEYTGPETSTIMNNSNRAHNSRSPYFVAYNNTASEMFVVSVSIYNTGFSIKVPIQTIQIFKKNLKKLTNR